MRFTPILRKNNCVVSVTTKYYIKMKRTTKQVIAEQQALNRKIWAKENGRLHHLDANKLIAEFMGLNIDRGVQSDYMEHELRYHESWDWLIPVVQRLIDEYISIDEQDEQDLQQSVLHDKIDSVYQITLEIIEKYNSEDRG